MSTKGHFLFQLYTPKSMRQVDSKRPIYQLATTKMTRQCPISSLSSLLCFFFCIIFVFRKYLLKTIIFSIFPLLKRVKYESIPFLTSLYPDLVPFFQQVGVKIIENQLPIDLLKLTILLLLNLLNRINKHVSTCIANRDMVTLGTL